jgi:hypothetical protein
MNAFENQTPLSLTFCDVSKEFDRIWVRGLIYNRKKARLEFMNILMSKDVDKNIFKDCPLINFTNTTKKRYWSIVRSIKISPT